MSFWEMDRIKEKMNSEEILKTEHDFLCKSLMKLWRCIVQVEFVLEVKFFIKIIIFKKIIYSIVSPVGRSNDMVLIFNL